MKITDGRVRVAASDVANFLACRRLTQLDLLRARGELRPPREFDIGFQDLVRIHPASQFWALQGLEGAIFLLLAAGLVGACFWRVAGDPR